MRQDRNFYVLKENLECVPVDLEQNYLKNGADPAISHSYQYGEIFHCSEYTDTGNDYERNGCRIQPGDYVVDIGGNIGIFARRAWERGAERIISFEPQRKVFSCFLMNAKEGMEPYNFAISDSEKFAILDFGGSLENTGGGSISANYKGRGIEILHEEKVFCTTLDKMIETGIVPKCDFLKIDCEGAEYEVLNGISDENLSSIRCISMEIHRNVIDDQKKDEILGRIERLGFKIFQMFWADALVTVNCWKEK